MITRVRKRDGQLVPFRQEKITWAIYKAAVAVGGDDFTRAQYLSDEVVKYIGEQTRDDIADVEVIQDATEKILIENGHAKTAKAFILYREKRRGARENNALIGATINMFSDYLDDKDWQIQENANTQKSINGMNNYVRETLPSSIGCMKSTLRRCASRMWRGICTCTTSASSGRTARAGISVS